MPTRPLYPWKKAPFVRLLIPLIAGILLQHYIHLPTWLPLFTAGISLLCLVGFFFLPFFHQYQFARINGVIVSFLFLSIGTWLALQKDIRQDPNWFGHKHNNNSLLLVTLDEPPTSTARSWKAEASVTTLFIHQEPIPVKGRIIIYFRKDTTMPVPDYGSRLMITKNPVPITNTGNPGTFDYKRYCLLEGITHQLYLQPGEYIVTGRKQAGFLKKFLMTTRHKILSLLQNHIRSEKERGLAQALLIGYKNDLDKTLVQSYSNTGVVHIIAISGLHLGLIYWLLLKLLSPLRKRKKWPGLHAFLVIGGLWLFSILAGGQPSVLRSALMFSCVIAGESLSRRSPIYNSLALSAFLLLCFNPNWLWDIGFQMSYAAVLGIVKFNHPVYTLFYFKHKLPDLAWKLSAVTLSAQVFTLPLSIYYFHQFPNYFILTNLLSVPLSGLILTGEILLCCLGFLPLIPELIGQALTWTIRLMNTYIETIAGLPFSLWEGLRVNVVQAILLTVFLTGFAYWLIERSSVFLKTALSALLVFMLLRSVSFIRAGVQEKIIVYNVPRKTAIDFIQGRSYYFLGDSSLQQDNALSDFHLKPSRTLHRIRPGKSAIPFFSVGNYLSWGKEQILLLDRTIEFSPQSGKPIIDLLVLSGNPRVYISRIARSIQIKQVVTDSSVPDWKATLWKKDCNSLQIPFHQVSVKGAFVMTLR